LSSGGIFAFGFIRQDVVGLGESEEEEGPHGVLIVEKVGQVCGAIIRGLTPSARHY
jgi:hypothetical protein